MSPSESVNLPQEDRLDRSDAYFSSTELAQRTDLLRHLTENSNLIPLVRGDEGIGKSTFISHLLELAPENWVTAEIDADVMLQPEALLANLARLFDLNDTGDHLMEDLALRFDDLRQDGYLPVIIVDDAHLLPEASIIALLRLHERGQNDNPLAQLLLFAEPEIDDLLKTPQLRVMNLQLLQLLDMPVFTKEQAECYLKHLLATEESMSIRPLSTVQIEKIYRDSGGLPGLIKQQAIALIDSYTKKTAKFELPEFLSIKMVLGGGAALIVVLLGLIYQDSINDIFSDGKDPAETTQKIQPQVDKVVPLELPEPTPEQPQKEQVASLIPDETITPEGEVQDLGQTIEAEPVAAEEEVKNQVPANESISQPQQVPITTQPEPAAEPKPSNKKEDVADRASVPSATAISVEDSPVEQDHKLQKQDAPQPNNIRAKPEGQKDKDVAEKPVSPAIQIEQKTEVSQVEQAQKKQQAKPSKPKVTTPAPKVKTKVALVQAKPKPSNPIAKVPVIPVEDRSSFVDKSRLSAPAPVEDRSTVLVKKEVPTVKSAQQSPSQEPKNPEVSTKTKVGRTRQNTSFNPMRESWIMKQRPASYTIQLVGLQDEEGISGFIRRYQLPGPVAYYRTFRNGKSWFPVLHGVYKDRKIANEAITKFPEKLKKSGVWLRTFGSVQKDIRAR